MYFTNADSRPLSTWHRWVFELVGTGTGDFQYSAEGTASTRFKIWSFLLCAHWRWVRFSTVLETEGIEPIHEIKGDFKSVGALWHNAASA